MAQVSSYQIQPSPQDAPKGDGGAFCGRTTIWVLALRTLTGNFFEIYARTLATTSFLTYTIGRYGKQQVEGCKMVDFVTLTCPSCGGKLQGANNIELFICTHCGVEHILKSGGGVVALHPETKRLDDIKLDTGRTASKLAIRRLSVEISSLQRSVNQLEKPQKTDWLGWRRGIGSVVVGIGGFIVALANINSGLEEELICLFPSTILLMIFGVSKIWRLSNKVKPTERIKGIKKTIIEKSKELNEHREIVRSY